MAETNKLMVGSDILVQCLVNQGVEVVFAYPGGASMPIHQSLTRFSDRLRTILRATSKAAASRPRATPAPPARWASA